jgi:hypothetical protein
MMGRACGIVGLLLGMGTVSAHFLSPTWTRISSTSPYQGCRSAGANGLFANAEVEPSLAADPHRQALIAVFQQDRFSTGAARGLAASYSRDVGEHWFETGLPFSACARGQTTGWPRASDPWVSIGPDSRAYVIGVGRGIAVATSSDGGHVWSSPLVLASNTAAYLMDKCTITADPTRAGFAYAVWQRFLTRRSGPPIESDTMLSITRDGGRHWSPPAVVLRHTKDAGDVASVVLPDPRRHRLFHLAYWQAGGFPGAGAAHLSLLLVQTSRDGGRTWSKSRRIARIETVGGNLRDPASGKVIRPGAPSFALEPISGRLYAAWQDARFSGGDMDQIALTSSRDGGRTWAKPQRVDSGRDTLGIVPVVAAAAGTVAVSYYAVSGGRGRNSRLWLATLERGASSFKRRIVGRAFTLGDAPLLAGDPSLLVPPGLFLGDYSGLAIAAGRAYLAFATANSDKSNPTDIRFASVKLD